MTYNVFGGTLSLTQSINQSVHKEELVKFSRSSVDIGIFGSILRCYGIFLQFDSYYLEKMIGSS